MLAVGLLLMAFIMLKYDPSIFTLMRVFIVNGCLILSNAFSVSIEMIMWFLSFFLLMWCITLIDLHMLNHSCDPRINPAWSWCLILVMYCCIWFANICSGFLHLCSSKILAYNFLLLLCLCVVLVSGQGWTHTMDLGVLPPVQSFGIVWEG